MIVWMTLSDWRSLPTLSWDEIEGERERDKKEKGIEMEETAQLSIWYVRKIIKSTSKSNKAHLYLNDEEIPTSHSAWNPAQEFGWQ